MRDYLNRFRNITVNTNPFSESLLRDKTETMVEVCRRVTTYIEAEEVMKKKQAEERRPMIKCTIILEKVIREKTESE